LYALNGQFVNAQKYLQQSLKIEPDNGTAAIRLGKIL
jgi:cytochrome c-type biogenesis protein CcmH/NrfG